MEPAMQARMDQLAAEISEVTAMVDEASKAVLERELQLEEARRTKRNAQGVYRELSIRLDALHRSYDDLRYEALGVERAPDQHIDTRDAQ